MYGSVYSKLFECFVFRIMSFTNIEKLKTKYTSNKSNYKLKLFSKKFPYSIIIPSLDKHTFAKILSSILNYLDITRKMNKNLFFLGIFENLSVIFTADYDLFFVVGCFMCEILCGRIYLYFRDQIRKSIHCSCNKLQKAPILGLHLDWDFLLTYYKVRFNLKKL